MSDFDEAKHGEMLNRFIAIANEYKNDDTDPQLVSSALMAASCVYTSYVAAGNEGVLLEPGIDRVVDMYRQHLVRAQDLRRAELEAKQSDKA